MLYLKRESHAASRPNIPLGRRMNWSSTKFISSKNRKMRKKTILKETRNDAEKLSSDSESLSNDPTIVKKFISYNSYLSTVNIVLVHKYSASI